MKTILVAFVVVVSLLVPILLVVRYFAYDETDRLRKAFREEQEAWNRMRRVMEKDIQHMRDTGLNGRERHDNQ